jgi:aspartyl-tRNA(Asn)/glutamyl-tRNA(Gln) amidotransferase subunit A
MADDTLTSDVTTWPLTTQARAVRLGDLTAESLVRAHLDRIDQHGAALNAFLAVDREGALEAARAVDIARNNEGPLGPLAGVPIAVKDQIVTRGVPTTAGSRMLAGWVPPYDATAVSRLKKAGAVILGKTNQDEFAMGSSSESSAFGPAKNPWDLTRVPGGSSGGSAVAVAAHLASAALGTDTGGSVRQPASFCGVVGIKPTYGRVSRYGAIAYASSLDQISPLARNVPDLALMLQVIAGQDPLDQTSLPMRPPELTALAGHTDVAGLRIGIPDEYLGEGVEPDVRERARAALAHLEDAGATLVPVSLPHTKYAIATYYLIATAEASSNLARFDGVRYGHRTPDEVSDIADLFSRSRAEGFGPEVQRRIMLGTFALSSGYYDAYYLRAQKVRTLIRRDFEAAFASVDLIAGPVSPVTAFKLGERTTDPLAMYLADIFTVPTSLAGLPAVSVPVGLDRASLPIGLQLIGPPLQELRLLQVAHALEVERPQPACPYALTPVTSQGAA